MELFNWEAFRKKLDANEPTREAMIGLCFKEYVDGNDSFQDKSSAEMSDYYATFRSAWILSEMILAQKR